MRSHNGVLYHYLKDEGFWRIFTGLLPEGVHNDLRDFMNTLEGMFRCIPTTTARSDDGVVKAIQATIDTVNNASRGLLRTDMHSMKQTLRIYRDAALLNKGDRKARTSDSNPVDASMGRDDDAPPAVAAGDIPVAHADQAQGEADKWPILVAQLLRKITPTLLRELTKASDVVKHFVEWCGTPNPKVKGFAYGDRTVLYDVGNQIVSFLPEPNSFSNIYLGTSSCLLLGQEVPEDTPPAPPQGSTQSTISAPAGNMESRAPGDDFFRQSQLLHLRLITPLRLRLNRPDL